jgi:predicted GIY-YIG superfamily endonuclease
MRKRVWSLPHDVYRVRDAAGNLLYVGCSVNAFRRIQQHKAEYQPWFPAAATVDIEQYEDFRSGRLVEALAIEEESPLWNRAKESMALIRGRDLRPVVLEAFEGIPISEFWRAA